MLGQNFPLVPFATAESSDPMELALSQHGYPLAQVSNSGIPMSLRIERHRQFVPLPPCHGSKKLPLSRLAQPLQRAMRLSMQPERSRGCKKPGTVILRDAFSASDETAELFFLSWPTGKEWHGCPHAHATFRDSGCSMVLVAFSCGLSYHRDIGNPNTEKIGGVSFFEMGDVRFDPPTALHGLLNFSPLLCEQECQRVAGIIQTLISLQRCARMSLAGSMHLKIS